MRTVDSKCTYSLYLHGFYMCMYFPSVHVPDI